MVVAIVVLVFLIAFPLLWICIMAIISVMSGWNNLANSYANSDVNGTLNLGYHGIQMGYNSFLRAQYSGWAIRFGQDDEAIYMSPIWAFRFRHQPLRIPRDHISISESKVPILNRVYCLLRTRKNPSIHIVISKKLLRRAGLIENDRD